MSLADGTLGGGSVVAAAAISLLIAGARMGAQQLPRFGERVDVERAIVDACPRL